MSPIRMSKIEASARLVLEFNDAFNRHDVAAMMKLMSEDCIFENTDPAPDGTVYSGKAAVTQFWQSFFREAPQAQIEIEEIFGMGNQLCHALEVQLGRRSRPRRGHLQGRRRVDLREIILRQGLR